MNKTISVEQEKILLSRDKHISISAFAGAGKSSTLIEVVRFNPTEKILYLVYNKAMQIEFAERMEKHNIKNCEIKTIHGLAFQWYIKTHGYKVPKSVSMLDIINLLQFSGDDNDEELSKEDKKRIDSERYLYADSLDFHLKSFMASDMDEKQFIKTIEDDKMKKDFKAIWKTLTNSKTIDHNVYLKLYQLSSPKLKHSMILVDEFQDCTKALISILLNNKDKRIVVCGDKYQSINNFNHTVNGLEILEDEHNFASYSLTMSYRTSEEVAKIGSRLLGFFYDKPISFNGSNKTIVCDLDIKEATTKDKITVLCRNRLSGLQYLMDNVVAQDLNKKVYLEGGIERWISEVETMIKYDKIIVGGKSYNAGTLIGMIKNGLNDAEAKKMLSLYSYFKKNPVQLLRNISAKTKAHADIILNTMHSSKGSEYQNVILLGDVSDPATIKMFLGLNEDKYSYDSNMLKAEINLIYVALTRATEKLDIRELIEASEEDEELEIKKYKYF